MGYDNNSTIVKMGKKEVVFLIEEGFYTPTETTEKQGALMATALHRTKWTICSDGKAYTANLPVEEFPAVLKRTEHLFDTAKNAGSTEESSAKEATGAKPAESGIVLPFGKLKGKNPERYLAETGDVEGLKKSRDFLSENVKKFPANQKFIDAINQAIEKFEKGELKKEATAEPAPASAPSEAKPEVIYETPVKNFSKKNSNNENMVYTLKITFVPGQNYPFVVEIANGWGTVTKREDGRNSISDIHDMKSQKFRVSADDFYNALVKVEKTIASFEALNAASVWALVEAGRYHPEETPNK